MKAASIKLEIKLETDTPNTELTSDDVKAVGAKALEYMGEGWAHADVNYLFPGPGLVLTLEGRPELVMGLDSFVSMLERDLKGRSA
jgi:hypothetical protein